jgi:hypothetical protein
MIVIVLLVSVAIRIRRTRTRNMGIFQCDDPGTVVAIGITT